MTTIPFPANRIAKPLDRRAEIEALARELGGVVVWPNQWPSLTPREASVLALMGERVPRTAISIAADLLIDESWTRTICRRLAAKGYAERSKRGWLRVTQPISRAA